MKTIVLAGDNNYKEQLSTTIKSIFYYNPDVKIYVLNVDLSPDWFRKMKKLAQKLGSHIIDIRLDSRDIDEAWATQHHITPITYARYFIPRYIQEDRVLYLDSDLLVRGDLTPFYELDLQGYPLAAVRDADGQGFNAGVLLIDNKVWREQALLEDFLEKTKQNMQAIKAGHVENFNGDQTILNQVLEDSWLELDNDYNLQAGHDLVAFYSGWTGQFENKEPLIIHYTTYRKPWNSLASYRYRDLWWDFYNLDFQDIIKHHEGKFTLLESWDKKAFRCLIMTDVQGLEQIDYMVSQLAQCHFHIACYTEMGEKLLALGRYDNIHLHPQIIDPVLDQMIEKCHCYLDIHHGSNLYELNQRFADLAKPQLAFDNTVKGQAYQAVISHEKPQDMVAALSDLAEQVIKKPEGKAIVLTANYNYSDQVLTTIKSICYHNRGIKFYIINPDFPSDWFVKLNERLDKLDCQVINARVNSRHISRYQTNIHYATFLRYFISDFVQEDKVLYLDCDMVVTADLQPLFDTDLGQAPLAAVKDLGGQAYFDSHEFNAGLLLINNKVWKEKQVSRRLIELTDELHDKVRQDDQSILNILFENRWLELPFAYNCISLHTHFSDYRPAAGGYPPIIHYLTERKPWKEFTQTIYRDVWWFYNALDWSDFGAPLPALRQDLLEAGRREKLSCMVYTYSCELYQIDYLIQLLADCHFYIAAPVVVADEISRLLAYPNVSVCSDIGGLVALLDSLVEKSQVLLDINTGDEVDGIVSRFRAAGKPVLAFTESAHGQQGQQVFAQDQAQDMVQAIRDLMEVEARKPIQVKPIKESLDYILAHHSSVVRFGDGEMDIMTGHSIPYQDYDADLASRLKEIIGQESSPQLLVCLSDVFENLERYNQAAVDFWQGHLLRYCEEYRTLCHAPWYGSTFISRPYIDLQDKSLSAGYFAQLKSLWQDRDLLIVEGATSRSGVGNDLFAQARSIKRIICPSKNAFARCQDIRGEIEKYGQDHLVLLMLGPTAKVLAYDLAQAGYQAIDMGHIDSEYEWFKMGASHKVRLSHKHTAEFNFDEDIHWQESRDYQEQIVARLD